MLNLPAYFHPLQAAEMAKRYEAKGGGYEDTGDNANEAKTGPPKPKKEAIERGERKDPSEAVGTPKSPKKSSDKKDNASKESSSKRKSDDKADEDKDNEGTAESKEKAKKPKTKKETKPAAKGTRTQPKRSVKK